MRIGIIGAGYIGRALAVLARQAGHEVMIANSRGPETLASTAVATGSAAGTAEQAARFGEVVVVAVPLSAIDALPAAALAGLVVVDANNYYPQRDGAIAALDERRTTTSALLAERLPEARVVKAFNAIRYNDLERDGRPRGTPGRRALPIAGDDPAATAVVADLVDQFGFDPVDTGGLADSWRFERAKPAYCVPLDRTELLAALDAAERDTEVTEGSWRKVRLDDYSVERLADRARIQDLIARYCRAVDRLDFDALRATYHPDATDDHGFHHGGVDSLVGWVRERHRTIPFSMHAIQNMLVTFTDVDRAVVETYVTCAQTYPPDARENMAQLAGDGAAGASGTLHLVMFGRYVDEVERRSGEWRFAARHVVYDSGMVVDAAAGAVDLPGGWLRGRRDRDDPLYRLLEGAAGAV